MCVCVYIEIYTLIYVYILSRSCSNRLCLNSLVNFAIVIAASLNFPRELISHCLALKLLFQDILLWIFEILNKGHCLWIWPAFLDTIYIYIYIYIYREREREREREALNCVWLIINAHETKEDFVFEQLNCAFLHNKFYARTLSVSLIFLFLFRFLPLLRVCQTK